MCPPLVDIHHHRKRDQAEAQRDVHLAIHLCGGGDGVGRDRGDGGRDFGVLGRLGGFSHFCRGMKCVLLQASVKGRKGGVWAQLLRRWLSGEEEGHARDRGVPTIM